MFGDHVYTLPETHRHNYPLKIGLPTMKVVTQTSMFRGYVSFKGCNVSVCAAQGESPLGGLTVITRSSHILSGSHHTSAQKLAS